MPRAVVGAALAVLGFSMSVVGEVRSASHVDVVGRASAMADAVDVGECVTFGSTERSDGVAYDVASSCEVPVSCVVEWTLWCGEGAGRARHAERAALSLDAGEKGAVFASATRCSPKAWEVGEARWRCDPAGAASGM